MTSEFFEKDGVLFKRNERLTSSVDLTQLRKIYSERTSAFDLNKGNISLSHLSTSVVLTNIPISSFSVMGYSGFASD